MLSVTAKASSDISGDYRLLLAVAMICLSLVYFFSSYVLLHSKYADILFVEQERSGLQDYQRVIAAYFELQETKQPKKIIPILFQAPPPFFHKTWEETQLAFDHSGTMLTFPAAIVVLKNLILQLADQSNLILDPELPSYYLSDLLFNQLTILTECKQDEGSIDEASHVLAVLDAAHVPHLDHLRERVIAIQGLCRKNTSTETGSTILVHARAIAAIAGHILDDLLAKRLDNLRHIFIQSSFLIAVLYVLQIILIFFAARNFVNHHEVKRANDRLNLIRRLTEKNEELDTFAYAAAHDLKEPVRTMRSFAMLLKKEAQSGLEASVINYLDVIEGAAVRAEDMINDLLGYTQLNEVPPISEMCDCAREIAAVLIDLKPILDRVQPIINISVMPVIQTVPSMFRRIILNLVDNATKYRKEDVCLEIRIEAIRRGNAWAFSVVDNGIGMTEQETQTVCQPFRRLPAASHIPGSGFGLTSCKKIVDCLGGEIKIISQPQKGTSVIFVLPDTKADSA